MNAREQAAVAGMIDTIAARAKHMLPDMEPGTDSVMLVVAAGKALERATDQTLSMMRRPK